MNKTALETPPQFVHRPLLLGMILLLVWVGVWAVFFWPLTVDDAFIIFRFSHHGYLGHGLAWNIGETPAEGMTSLLWTFLMVPFSGDVHQVYAWAKILGLLTLPATFFCLSATIHLLWGGDAVRKNLWIMMAVPIMVFHALNGMETGLVLLVVSAMLYAGALVLHTPAIEASRRRGRMVAFGVVWLLAGMTRPELVLYGFLLAALTYSQLDADHRRLWIRTLIWSFVLPGAIYFLLRWSYFGRLFPLTFYAKKSTGLWSESGLGYVSLSLVGLLFGAAVMAITGWVRAKDSAMKRQFAWLVIPAVLLTLSYAPFNPFMGFAYRFTLPFFLPLLIGAVGLVTLARPAVPRWVWLLVGLTTLQMGSTLIPTTHWIRYNAISTKGFHQAFGEALGQLPEKGTLLAFNDIGGPSLFSKWVTYEGQGLVTPKVVESEPRHSAGELVDIFKPDVILQTRCRPDAPYAEYTRRGYRLIKPIPWIIFDDAKPSYYQCVFGHPKYSGLQELEQAVAPVGVPVFTKPWYLKTYHWIKRVALRQPL